MPVRYFIRLPDPEAARGSDPAISFHANGAPAFAEQLQQALCSSALFEHWRGQQDDPDEVDQTLGVVDPSAQVSGEDDNLGVNLVATTSIPGRVLKHRLSLLAGNAWELRDVAAA
ncbi:hypothetical protein [Pseudoxanthomonas dokdonensis]|uniref:Uncharacterized protein n=1 Tax=Pseudoxanthomonas dokdonensis TaxID=344882 RepID=A0A0R0CPX0_9GAMM|nr:hypothetical protein [Pseudoxanthomonas dokdonensis]KRG67556.1 hypothetical protein ABB29_15455 [Pseudoxanthomonas dokdonensis]